MSRFVDEALQILGDFGDNRQNLLRFERYRTQLAPFVGSGLSVAFGYPTWSDLLKVMARHGVRNDVDALLRYWKYEEAAQEVYENLPPKVFRERLKSAFDENKLPGPITQAIAHLPHIAGGLVITTNLDRALERAYDDQNTPFQSVFSGADLRDASAAIQRGDRVLLKLHGDFLEGKQILTLEQYQSAYGSEDPSKINFDLPLPRLLDQILKSRTLLFLGCSLNADRTVRVMASVVKDLGVQHFALLSTHDNKGPRLEQFREFHINPIFYPAGKYDRIQGISRFLGWSKKHVSCFS